jgi:hypothetical protein
MVVFSREIVTKKGIFRMRTDCVSWLRDLVALNDPDTVRCARRAVVLNPTATRPANDICEQEEAKAKTKKKDERRRMSLG